MIAADIHALLAAFAARLGAEQSAAAQAMAGLLCTLGTDAGSAPPTPNSVPTCRWLPTVSTASASTLLQAAVSVAAMAHWHEGPRGADGEEYGIAYTVLAGPDGRVAHDGCRAGLYVQRPDFLYREHAHDPAEFYLLLSGAAEWRVGGRCFTAAPGQLIYHAPAEPHAMTTQEAPLFALWAWPAARGRYWFCDEQ